MLIKSKPLQSEFKYLDFSLIDIIEDQISQLDPDTFTSKRYNIKHCLMTNSEKNVIYYDPAISITDKITMNEKFIVLKDMDLDTPLVSSKYAKEMMKYIKFRTLEKEIELFNNE